MEGPRSPLPMNSCSPSAHWKDGGRGGGERELELERGGGGGEGGREEGRERKKNRVWERKDV